MIVVLWILSLWLIVGAAHTVIAYMFSNVGRVRKPRLWWLYLTLAGPAGILMWLLSSIRY